MGAKAPEQVKKSNKPRPPIKCQICGRKFLNNAALKSHHKQHLKPEPAKTVAVKKQDNARILKKKMVHLHMLNRLNPPEETKVEKKTTVPVKSTELAVKSPATRKAEFECPVCAEKFPVYFTAFRHIQKNHCVDSQGDTVPPNSPHLVKPIRIETCASCSQQIRSTAPHDCPKMQMHKDQYMCLGCDQVFNGLVLFQHHVKGLHADGSQNYFFSNRSEFESWRAELQDVINIEFIRLNRPKTKEIYHCSHQPSGLSSATRLCPASITAREYLRGIHICYYREHFGHVVEQDGNIQLKNFNKYSISLHSKESEDLKLEAEDDNELYMQLKNMVTCIIADAAKVDGATLKDLCGRALEMTTVLKKYNEEVHNSTLVGKSLSDDQITKTLVSMKPKQSKRKQNLQVDTKKVEVVAKKVKKTPSAVENGTARVSRSNSVLNKSVSFNKSTSKNKEKASEIVKEKPEKNIEVTPQRSIRKKTEEQTLKSALKKAEQPQIVEDIEAKKQEDPPAPVTRAQLQSPSSFNDSYKNFVDQNFKSVTETSTPKPKVNVKKKEIVKTKMGQFKPASPKHQSPKPSPKSPKEVVKEVPVTPVVFKAKADIKYVVKEQENDCNILILKI